MEYFCRTGRLWHTPDSIYAPLEPRDRWEVLRRFCEDTNPSCTRLLLREPSVSFSSRLEITSFWDGSIAFSYELSPNKYAILFLYEKSLSACFDDLFSYLMEGNLVCTLSETKAYLRQKMDELEKTFWYSWRMADFIRFIFIFFRAAIFDKIIEIFSVFMNKIWIFIDFPIKIPLK